jgi:NADPH:quinone reductase-like Zn-dependent oxidoreductase
MRPAAIKSTPHGGIAAATGGSRELSVSVLPFILRGVSLLGVDSVQCPMELRRTVWKKLAGEWKPEKLDAIVQECTLHNLEKEIHAILKGQLRGRVLVNLLES